MDETYTMPRSHHHNPLVIQTDKSKSFKPDLLLNSHNPHVDMALKKLDKFKSDI